MNRKYRLLMSFFLVLMSLPASGCGWLWNHPIFWRDHGPYLGPAYGGPYPHPGGGCDSCGGCGFGGVNPCGPKCHWFNQLAGCLGCGDIYWGDWKHKCDILTPCDHHGNYVGPHQLYPGQHYYDHEVEVGPHDGPYYEGGFDGPVYEGPVYDGPMGYHDYDHGPEVYGPVSHSAGPAPDETIARRSSPHPVPRSGCRHCQQSGLSHGPHASGMIR